MWDVGRGTPMDGFTMARVGRLAAPHAALLGGPEHPHCADFFGRNNDHLLARRHSELLLLRQPGVERDQVGRGVVDGNVVHRDATRAAFMPAAEVRSATRATDDHRHAVQRIVTRVEDVPAHAQ